jgi:hypothetical protein
MLKLSFKSLFAESQGQEMIPCSAVSFSLASFILDTMLFVADKRKKGSMDTRQVEAYRARHTFLRQKAAKLNQVGQLLLAGSDKHVAAAA